MPNSLLSLHNTRNSVFWKYDTDIFKNKANILREPACFHLPLFSALRAPHVYWYLKLDSPEGLHEDRLYRRTEQRKRKRRENEKIVNSC